MSAVHSTVSKPRLILRLRASDAARVRDELLTLATSWRQVLADAPTHARPIVSSLLRGRVTFTPTKAGWWEARGQGSFEQLFMRVFSSGADADEWDIPPPPGFDADE